MNDQRDAVSPLNSLAIWSGPIDVELLPLGITNTNYLVRCGTSRFVARLGSDRPVLGIDRRNEVACQREAHARGVAPRVVHHEPGVLISDYVSGRTVLPGFECDCALIPKLAALLSALHHGRDELPATIVDFCVFKTVRAYAQTARRLGAKLPDDLAGAVDEAGRLECELAPFVPALCHNDLLVTNLIDDGDRLWLVDWEYAGIGRPLFDLASFSANDALSDASEIALLTAYRGTLNRDELRELRILRAMSHLREALWGAIQAVMSEIRFDYPGYAKSHLAAYHEARARLTL